MIVSAIQKPVPGPVVHPIGVGDSSSSLIATLTKRLWLRGDLWPSGAPANGAIVGTWFDQSGNGFNAVQTGSDVIKPAFLASGQGGRPGLSFVPSQRLAITGAVLSTSGPFTVIIVASSNATSALRFAFTFGSGNGIAFGRDTGGTPPRTLFCASVGSNTDGPATTNTEAWIATRDGPSPTATSVLLVDGVQQTLLSSTINVATPSAVATVGAAGTGNTWTGVIYEIVVLDFLVTAAQKTRIASELAAYYAIP